MASLTALSFLGTGDYSPTTYTWKERTCRTCYMPVALDSIFAPDELLVAETPGAREMHGTALQEACTYTPVEVPRVTAEADWWRMFNVMAEAVPEGTTLLVDITHGFRSQPFLALAVILYLRVVKSVEVKRVVYGAYEAGEEDRSPVVDLTAFLNLIDWAAATEQFQQYGDAAPLRDIFQGLATESRLSNQAALHLEPVGDTLRRLTRALSLNRPIETLEEADGLIEEMEQAMDDAMNVPPAKPAQRLMLLVAERFAPLGHAGGSVFTHRGFAAQAAMLRFYGETGQYLQAFTLAQEMLVSWVCVQRDLDPLDRGGTDPERAGRKGGRAILADWDRLSPEERKRELADHEQNVAAWWNALRTKRNDVAHAGFSYNPEPAEDLIADAESLLYDIAAFFAA